MIEYFGYGSNLDFTSLRAKGVVPKSSRPAVLRGWRLRFNVEHFFRHEGGVGNIEPTGDPNDRVLGVLHLCDDDDIAALDRLEAYGIGYDRIAVDLETSDGRETGIAYVGMPDFINDACRPTRRYLNILVRGAEAAGLDADYVAALRSHPVLEQPDLPPFAPADAERRFTHADLERNGLITALSGEVFDMSRARPRHDFLRTWFGGREVTLFLLKRMDSSDGAETLDDVTSGRLSQEQRRYLNLYLHAFAEEYDHVGRFDYSSMRAE